MVEHGKLDPYSGNLIRKTENEHDTDILSPQAQNPLHLDANGLPAWWNDLKEKRGDIDGDR